MRRKRTVLTIARLFGAILGALLWLTAAVPCFALDSQLQKFIAQVPAADVMPGADHYGPVQGSPPVAKIFAGDKLLGYAFVNADWVNSTGYSGQPIQILEGLTTDGKISGARLMAHHEPIVLIGIPLERIETFIRGYVGRDVLAISQSAPSDRPAVDIVSGATVTVAVIAESMVRAAIKVANAEGMGGPVGVVAAVRELDPSHAAPADWNALVSEGAVRRLSLSVGEVTEAFRRVGNENGVEHPEDSDPATTFIDLFVAPVSIPAIGKSLLGADGFASLQKTLAAGQQAILVASNGAYSFKGSGYVRGGIFDRFEILQSDSSIRFRDRDHTRIGDIRAVGAPNFRDVDLFRVPVGTMLDPAQPWRLQLLAQRAYGSRDKAFLTFDVNYQLPEAYLKPAPAAPSAAAANAPAPSAAADAQSSEPPMWHAMWGAKTSQISVLVAALALLTLIFFFQDWLVRRPVFYDRLRLCFLVFTLVWIGWIAQAQLSVVNVLAFLSALRTDFRWDYFLMAPLIFILWFAAAASLLFWNRGAYCGWLCPFGALQELTNRLARRLNVPQLKLSFGVHQRLTALKYIIFLVLFGISLSDLGLAERMSEVEPFKTAIILKFARQWPFVLYAGAMVASSLFVERAFCRYVCPMGAALAIPARLRLFDWLRRYRECGVPCQRCGNECPVQAIHPEGHINPNECIQCLHCQMLYHHDQKCPVMIQRRLKRERHSASSGAGASHVPLPPKTKVSAQGAD
jgi:NosR/NirI family transcriptional regulator, nitrous oxide reductase regulator